ncbi:MAG: hypothetical protein AAB223_08355, partial [Pseudomonadota bacterium]
MVRPLKTLAFTLAGALAGILVAAPPASAQTTPAIESELVLITPVAKTLTDPTLADFAKFAKEKWNV